MKPPEALLAVCNVLDNDTFDSLPLPPELISLRTFLGRRCQPTPGCMAVCDFLGNLYV